MDFVNDAVCAHEAYAQEDAEGGAKTVWCTLGGEGEGGDGGGGGGRPRGGSTAWPAAACRGRASCSRRGGGGPRGGRSLLWAGRRGDVCRARGGARHLPKWRGVRAARGAASASGRRVGSRQPARAAPLYLAQTAADRRQSRVVVLTAPTPARVERPRTSPIRPLFPPPRPPPARTPPPPPPRSPVRAPNQPVPIPNVALRNNPQHPP
eukprot:TRINITY_DN7948_c0_g1_i1.p1 TRINITY_DN7948_c0_g1~~TRINITY_DN7948_c0_g1_i1.p1  ORF type:complete len:208 (-),score=5.24 TRINITY_DN7948_c0_g1_i1:241-864(-)